MSGPIVAAGRGEDRLAAEFRRRQAEQRGRTARGVVLAVLGLLCLRLPGGHWLVWLALGGLVWVLVETFRHWRCPRCERLLGKKLDPAACPYCGQRFV